MKNTKWILCERRSDDIIEQLLLNRSISPKDWDNFMDPDYKNGLHDPFLLEGMQKAIDRLKIAISSKEKIGIFGDYDADGIPASAMLEDVIKNKYLCEVYTYIPAREDGYGLNKKGIDFFREKGVTLLITVDLGVRNIDETLYAKNVGIDIIITDHHEPGENLPSAISIINPKLASSKYPFRDLSGGGVAFKLIQAMKKEIGIITDNDLKWLLDLVGITVICDMVPLVNENRIFAKYGILVLRKTKRIGLVELYKAAGIDAELLNTYTVGYQIGPRINAPGRIDNSSESFELLVSENVDFAKELAQNLNDINKKRQDSLDKILREVQNEIEKNEKDEKIIFLWNRSWPSGLVGLIAGRLTEKYNKPSFIFQKGEEESKGSARSIEGFDLVEILETIKDKLKSFGGHKKAAGLTIDNKNFETIYSKLVELTNKKIVDGDLVPTLRIDCKISTEEITWKLYDKIKKLEPFGLGNPKPVFLIENVKPVDIRKIGKNSEHLKFKVGEFETIMFNSEKLYNEIKEASLIDLACFIEENVWREKHVLQLKLIEIKVKS